MNVLVLAYQCKDSNNNNNIFSVPCARHSPQYLT